VNLSILDWSRVLARKTVRVQRRAIRELVRSLDVLDLIAAGLVGDRVRIF
jgi:hypothetical protein